MTYDSYRFVDRCRFEKSVQPIGEACDGNEALAARCAVAREIDSEDAATLTGQLAGLQFPDAMVAARSMNQGDPRAGAGRFCVSGCIKRRLSGYLDLAAGAAGGWWIVNRG